MSAFGFFLLHYSILLLCMGFPTGWATSGILGNETDRLALLAFKDLIHLDPGQVTSSWNDSLHFCKWTGVTCSRRHQRVSVLNLESQGLVGYLSPFVGNLSFLRSINLLNNSFQGEIPQEIGHLSRLQEFHMSNNSFTGEIPINISRCSNLKILRMAFNNLEGNLPIEIGSLSELLIVTFSSNNLTGGIPSSLGNLSLLNILAIGLNNLEGSIPDSLGQLKSMKTITMGPNMLSGIIPSSLYNLSSLETFSVPFNELTGSLPLEIGFNLPNLRFLLLGGNQFFGSIPVPLFNASRLVYLDFSQNNFTGKFSTKVENLKDLSRINLGINQFGSGKDDDLNFLDSLTNCTNLQWLSIDDNHFGGKLPNSFGNLSIQLSMLELGSNEIFGRIPSEIGKLFNLIELCIESNFLTGSIPEAIGMLRNLQNLDISGNRFSGQIPSSIGNISQLYNLDLSDNILEGNIVIPELGKCKFLQILDLFQNKLNGTIPKQIIALSSHLNVLNLAHNSLTGSLPLEIGKFKTLEYLDVSGNSLSGEIPSTLGSCSSLAYLCLQGNFFRGPIPKSISSLKGIQDLDLSHNNLSGQISKDLEDLSFLTSLNISFNDLEGEVPMKGVFQNASASSFVGNSKLCGGIPELHLPACSLNISKKRGTSDLVIKVTIGMVLFLIVVASFLIILYWRRKPRMKSLSTSFLGDWYKRVSYNGLHKATGGFASTNLIGTGNFGSVYKGVLHPDEIPVAVKVINLNIQGASKSFMAECKALRRIRHRNLLKIITACSSVDFRGNSFKALVFEFMPNGSLENWLHPSSDEMSLSKNLNFGQRLSIAIDIASALDYLHNHCQTPIIHCDLKPSNALLCNDMVAHVGDFGLAKILARNTSNSSETKTDSILIKGSIGYIPPEYGISYEVSVQGDVYSYGILLLEMFTGKRPTDEIFNDGLSLHHFSRMALTERVMEIVDPRLLLEEDHNEAINGFQNQRFNTRDKMQEYLISIFRIGIACSAKSLGDRMEIKDVLMELHMIKKMFVEDCAQ